MPGESPPGTFSELDPYNMILPKQPAYVNGSTIDRSLGPTPNSRDGERALLGTMLRDNTIIAETATLVSVTDFYTFAHSIVFRAIMELHKSGTPADLVTVGDHLLKTKQEAEIGGLGYLVELLDATPCAGHFRHYAEIIREHSKRRSLIYAARAIEEHAWDPGHPVADSLADAERRIVEIAELGATSGYRFGALDSAAFAVADYRPHWLIRRVLVKDQPCILGGPKKALKTSLLIDLGLSLGSATPFLGQFTVYEKIRTVVISGESGQHTIQETARRIAHAKGIDLAAVDTLWDFRLPQLANAIELAELGRGLRACGAKVAIIEPLYLALLAGQGQQGLQATNLYDMGPLLLRVADTCLNAGATPILGHHAKKTRPNSYDPLDLDELAFSGVAEFARQWFLVSRREAYESGTGIHRLWLSAGGSIGHGGLWALDIDEGKLDDDFGGRRWRVSVMTAGASKEKDNDAREDHKAERQKAKDKADDVALLLALDRLDPQREGAGYTKARDAARLDSARMTRAVDRLSTEGLIEELEVTVAIGNRAKRGGKGLRRRTSEHRE